MAKTDEYPRTVEEIVHDLYHHVSVLTAAGHQRAAVALLEHDLPAFLEAQDRAARQVVIWSPPAATLAPDEVEGLDPEEDVEVDEDEDEPMTGVDWFSRPDGVIPFPARAPIPLAFRRLALEAAGV